jgi:hypothetical protein
LFYFRLSPPSLDSHAQKNRTQETAFAKSTGYSGFTAFTSPNLFNISGPTKIFKHGLAYNFPAPSASQLIDYMTSCILAKSINLASHPDHCGEGLTDKTIEAKVIFA